MCDKKLSKFNESFQREQGLLNLMVSKDEDAGELATQLKKLSLTGEELNLVVHGPLSEAFYSVNCPFVWSEYIPNGDMESCITTLREKMDVCDKDWKSFSFHLYLSFLYARLRKLNDAFKELKICEEHVSENVDNEFYKEIIDGLNHGIQATKSHLYFLSGDAEMADKIISNIVPLKSLNNPSKAAVIAVNAEVLQEFTQDFKKMALEMMEVAIKLDPDDNGSRRGAWYYAVGNLYGQLRRMEHRTGMPSREELQVLERAIKMNPYSVSLAALADAYREASTSALFGRTVQISSEITFKMLSEAKQLYKRAIELDNESCSTLRRCGNGLMKLPAPHKDLPLAKQCLEKAISVNPNSPAAYQALGTLEEKYFKNLNGALKYFLLSYDKGNPVSGNFIVQVHMKMDRKYNPIDDLDKFIEDLQGNRQDLQAEFLIAKGEYLFFLRNDFLAAAKVWMEAISLAPHSENVVNHVSRFIHGRRMEKPYLRFVAGRCTFNVYECLKYEIGNALGTPRYSDTNKLLLQEFLKLCEENSAQ